jgi:hydrogenase expression/formation protein HypE
MAHGGGGTLMHQLIEHMFSAAFKMTGTQHDSVVLEPPKGKIAFTTDSYVIRPLLFPGGNIGSLAVHGTVNDLAMSGARPLYLSVGFILEEGLPMETLWTIVTSMAQAADEAKIRIVTGDTKVVERGHGDGIYINTSGVGVIEHNQEIHPLKVQPGDAVILSGDLGRHGIAVMATRSGLEFETSIESDSAILSNPILDLLKENIEVHCLRDCTRGGLLSTLNEIAQSSKLTIRIQEKQIPVSSAVLGACEMLGLDPISVANEGRFAAFIPQKFKEQALEILRKHKVTEGAVVIGEVEIKGTAPVLIQNIIGTTRIAPMLSGEQLPRIC